MGVVNAPLCNRQYLGIDDLAVHAAAVAFQRARKKLRIHICNLLARVLRAVALHLLGSGGQSQGERQAGSRVFHVFLPSPRPRT